MSDDIRLIRFDWAMKKILRNKANFDVLEGFLEVLLNKEITILEILESESNKEDAGDKFNRVDLLVKDNLGEKIIIEIQNNREVHYLERLLYGSSKVISESIESGSPYKEVQKVISVSIIYFLLGENLDDYLYYGKTDFRGVHTGSKLILKRREGKVIRMVEPANLYPEYYLVEVEKVQDIVNNDLDEWIYFFKNESIKKSFKSKSIRIAKEKLDFLKLSKEQRKRYTRYLENLAIEKDLIQSAWEEGEEMGREKGEEIGLEKGEAIGREKRDEEVVIRMIKEELSIEMISQYTGLTPQRIAEIKKKHNL